MLVVDEATDEASATAALEALATAEIVVSLAPVTDTVKSVVDGAVVATLPRDGLRRVCPPLALSAAAAALVAEPRTGSLAAWLDHTRSVARVGQVERQG